MCVPKLLMELFINRVIIVVTAQPHERTHFGYVVLPLLCFKWKGISQPKRNNFWQYIIFINGKIYDSRTSGRQWQEAYQENLVKF